MIANNNLSKHDQRQSNLRRLSRLAARMVCGGWIASGQIVSIGFYPKLSLETALDTIKLHSPMWHYTIKSPDSELHSMHSYDHTIAIVTIVTIVTLA